MLLSLLGTRQFRWSTIRVDKDSVARPQIAMDQIAPSIYLMIGAFRGGTSRSIDRTVELKDTNTLMVFDPRKPLLKEFFSGTRYAIPYSYHPANKGSQHL